MVDNEPGGHAEPLPANIPEVMRYAELYPSIPLRTVVQEVIHAQNTIEPGALDRTQIIDAIVTTRLASYDIVEPR